MASVTARAATRSCARGALPRLARACRASGPRPAAVAHRPAARPPSGARASFSANLRHRVRGSAPSSPLGPTPPTRGDTAVARALIAPGDSLELYTALLVCASLGAYAYKTAVGRALSGPVCAMVCGALFATLGVLPAPGPHYAAIQTATVSLATPALLFGADLRTVLKATGSLSVAFCVGSAAVAAAAFAAFTGLSGPMHGVGAAANGDGWKLAAALVAKNVGGGMNYVAVCDTLGVSPAAFSAGVAADNVFAVLYFPLTSFLGGPPAEPSSGGDRLRSRRRERNPRGSALGSVRGSCSFETQTSCTESAVSDWCDDFPDGTRERPSSDGPADWRDGDSRTANRGEEKKTETETETETETISAVAGDASSVTVGSLILATAVTCGVLTVATRIAPLGFGVLPTATLITVLLATATPPATSRFLKPSGDALGSCSLFVFFASAGAAGGAVSRAFAHPALFAYLFVLYVAHALVLFAVGKRILRLSTKELLVASSANVGGPATAGALAAGKNWTELVVPGMLVGNLGNAVGTFVGLGMAKAFYHLCW